MTKSCGTCAHWSPKRRNGPNCGWQAPALPFWATIINGDDADNTVATDGKWCETYTPVGEPK